ncbi:CcmD family protein [bacterium]|nr:CcmD family protein [bacterium]
MAEMDLTLRNAGYFQWGYLAIWILFFGYLVYLHRRLARAEKPDSK